MKEEQHDASTAAKVLSCQDSTTIWPGVTKADHFAAPSPESALSTRTPAHEPQTALRQVAMV